MKILHVTKKYPNALGGDAIVVSNLEKQQKLNGHKVIILTSNCDDIVKQKSVYKYGLKVSTPALDSLSVKRLLSLISLFLKSYKILKTERPDIIHTHSVDMAFFISFAARHYKIPIVHTFHIVTFNDPRQQGIRSKVELFFLRGASPRKIFVLSPADIKNFKAAGFNNVMFVPNGVNIEDWQVKGHKKKSNKFTFIAVGRLEEQKGFKYLIDAAAKLKRNHEDFQIQIFGEGSLKNDLQKQIDNLNLKDNVFLLGLKNPKQLRELYAAADAFILSSLWEGMPLSLLEAWAAGLPTIATKVNSVPFVAQNTSLLVGAARSVDLCKSMQEFLQNKERLRSFAKASLAKVKDYDWGTVNQAILSEYTKATYPRLIHVYGYYPPHAGGAEMRVQDLASRLAEKGYKIDVVTSSVASKNGTEPLESGLIIHRLPAWEVTSTPIPYFLPFSLWRLTSKSNSKTIFHVHVGHAFVPEISYIIARLRGAKYIAHIRIDMKPSSKLGIFLSVYKKTILAPILRRADKVIVLTDDYVDLLHGQFNVPKEKIVAIPNATTFPIVDKVDTKIHKEPRLLLVGRLAKQKNIPLLLRATQELIKRGFKLKVSIVGEGPSRNEISTLIRSYKLKKIVTLNGRLGVSELQKAYIDNDIVVQTSFEEGFSSVLIEAMASGKVLIASNIPGTKSIVKDGRNGLLIDPDSQTDLVSALERVISDLKLREQLIKNSLDDVKQYSWDKVIETTQLVYGAL